MPYPLSDHFDGRRFHNLNGVRIQPVSALPRLLATPRTQWPEQVPVTPRVPEPLAEGDEAVVTFVGHSTFLFQTPRGHFLTDPMWSERASPLRWAGPKRVRAPGVRLDDLPPIAGVLLSHNHYDHCDLRTLRHLADRFDPLFITLLGNAALLRAAGARRIVELDWWERTDELSFPVTATPAQHFAARGLGDRNRALWGGFAFTPGARQIFFAGDTGYGAHLRAIRERLGPSPLALLPIGAYEPRWFMRAVHMNPAEAVQAHRELSAEQSVAMHFGTFQLTPEGIDAPVEALRVALADAGLDPADFTALEPGESLHWRAAGR